MLTETIRIDDNRLAISEQPDLNDNMNTIGDGWLIEIDNNTEENQVSIPQPQGYNLRITYHTPEILSPAQSEWLISQMEDITEAINNKDKNDERWELLINMESLVKHYIVEESLTNYDAYLGSCFLYKDMNDIWNFGPLWDFSASGFGFKSELVSERQDQHWIGEIYKFSNFRKNLKEIWNSYYSSYGNSWIRPFLTKFYEKIKDAVKQSNKVWPDTPLNAEEGLEIVVASVTHGMNFNNKKFSEIIPDINEAAVNIVLDSEQNISVYNLYGILIMKNVSKNSIKNLAKGIYIIKTQIGQTYKIEI